MKIAVVGDRHTVLGFALAGVEGKEPDGNPIDTVKEYISRDDIGVLIITSEIAESARSEIERWQRERNLPIVVEIQEYGKELTRDRISDLLRRAVGMEIKT